MKYNLILLICFLNCIKIIISSKCRSPRGAEGFVKKSYEGTWYEIAKFQTAGGAFWERNCVCTSLEVVDEKGQLQAHNKCRDTYPNGKLSEVIGTLTEDTSNPGHFKQKMFWFTPSIDYTIIFQGTYKDEEYSVEYDCKESFFFGTNYCVHFLSRKPKMSEELLNYLIERVNELELNSENLELVRTKHEGCWNN
jgi:apolipoprotein D and lipocalin family protein